MQHTLQTSVDSHWAISHSSWQPASQSNSHDVSQDVWHCVSQPPAPWHDVSQPMDVQFPSHHAAQPAWQQVTHQAVQSVSHPDDSQMLSQLVSQETYWTMFAPVHWNSHPRVHEVWQPSAHMFSTAVTQTTSHRPWQPVSQESSQSSSHPVWQ